MTTFAMRCNRCHRPMAGTMASDGACECGGLIEATPPATSEPVSVPHCPNCLRDLFADAPLQDACMVEAALVCLIDRETVTLEQARAYLDRVDVDDLWARHIGPMLDAIEEEITGGDDV